MTGTDPISPDTAPAVPEEFPPPGAAAPAARRVGFDAPRRWLLRGWLDFQGTGFRGAFYGLIFALMGFAVSGIYATQWQLTMGLVAGFFLMGPFICTGVYELSRQRARGEAPSLFRSLGCWRRNLGGIGFFAAILTFGMIIWARVSVVMFALFSTTDFPTMQRVVGQIFSFDNPQFLVAWAGVGFVFASIAFAISVVSVPLMLDRRVDTMMAIFASARALLTSPGPVYLWAALIVLLIGLSMMAGFIPLIVTAPLVGHATWHAYQDLIEAEKTPIMTPASSANDRD